MRLVNSGVAKCPLVYGNGEWRVQTPMHLLISVEATCLSVYGSGEGRIQTSRHLGDFRWVLRGAKYMETKFA
jgi:hypothetical protein